MHPPQVDDFLWYFTHASDMYHGLGYQFYGKYTAYWPIGYPWFLSQLFRFTGPHVMAGLIANAALSVGIVLMVYRIGLQCFANRRIAFIAALAYSLLPSQIEWNAVLGSEELFTFLAMLSISLYLSSHNRGLIYTVLGGLCLGLACDVRPIPLLFPALIFLYEHFVQSESWRRSFVKTGLLAAAMCLAIAPVTIRNVMVLHHFVLISTNGGVNLWQGTMANGSYYWSWNRAINPLLAAGTNQILENQIGIHAALHTMAAHPLRTMQSAFEKLFFFYWVDWNVVSVTFALRSFATTFVVWSAMWVNTIVYWLWMAISVVGLIRVFRQAKHRLGPNPLVSWQKFALPLAFILYNSAVFCFFPAWDRFRYPIMPCFALFFAIGWMSLRRQFRSTGEIRYHGL